MVVVLACRQVAADLANAGISKVSICLASDNPKQYLEIMQPRVGAGGFPDVCAFVIACSEAGKGECALMSA